ncbi:MAG: GNAT family N-acetyltransferase [Alphaproteobacteria bacterium]|nr:GNAT family N-acetyltransferase [Alphaproteobacteria bacterium]
MLEQLAGLHRLAFGDKGWSAEEILKLKNSGAEVIASENAIIIYRVAADEAEILTLAVHPDHRRQGLAKTIIALMERDLKNIKKIFLEVSVENQAALELYKSLGFIEKARRPGYYQGVDAILMIKEIN